MKTKTKSGFTMIEVIMACSLTSLIIVPILSIHLWCGKTSISCEKKGSSQAVAMKSSQKIAQYIQGASSIADIDGDRLTLSYPDGSTRTIVYTNSPNSNNRGAIAVVSDNQNTEWLALAGVSEIMDESSDPPIFTLYNTSTGAPPSSVTVQYRVSQPSPHGLRDTADWKYAVKLRFTTSLRNK